MYVHKLCPHMLVHCVCDFIEVILQDPEDSDDSTSKPVKKMKYSKGKGKKAERGMCVNSVCICLCVNCICDLVGMILQDPENSDDSMSAPVTKMKDTKGKGKKAEKSTCVNSVHRCLCIILHL